MGRVFGGLALAVIHLLVVMLPTDAHVASRVDARVFVKGVHPQTSSDEIRFFLGFRNNRPTEVGVRCVLRAKTTWSVDVDRNPATLDKVSQTFVTRVVSPKQKGYVWAVQPKSLARTPTRSAQVPHPLMDPTMDSHANATMKVRHCHS